MIRTEKEIGRLAGDEVSKRVNDAYATYCSLYLDIVDDNLDKMMIRMINTRPLDRIKGEATEEAVYNAYKNACIDLAANLLMHCKYNDSYFRKTLIDPYPIMAQWKDEIKLTVAKRNQKFSF